MKFYEYNHEFDLEGKLIIGVDEVGVGDYFGPLCSAAAYIPKENLQDVINLGVKDSKKLSDLKIKFLASKLKKLVKYSVHQLSPKGYNTLNANYNANELKMFTHLNVITKLEQFVNDHELVFIDQYSTMNTIQKYYSKIVHENNWAKIPEIKKDVYLANKAEQICLEVAVASILARDFFLYKIDELEKKYGIKIPLGSSNKVKEFAKQLKDNRPEINMKDICKMSFKMEI
ncbi:ribonuclease HIII [Mycoplasma sp. Mirounga ES2805-ORL]|uniref:ribonuclease HIII n=1 Tax=Mycoplasma sp. Mirounga ES2805-ORL TaxID=754514 RepID=UPI00197B0DFE|nr:ribonuclease HIII [Mycoplasma sp. Mirounga ES2805-ORL]QSF13410.1 ribonuclease HIII [Mycoplasma sp. Mirounga ES2805-ORL]